MKKVSKREKDTERNRLRQIDRVRDSDGLRGRIKRKIKANEKETAKKSEQATGGEIKEGKRGTAR